MKTLAIVFVAASLTAVSPSATPHDISAQTSSSYEGITSSSAGLVANN